MADDPEKQQMRRWLREAAGAEGNAASMRSQGGRDGPGPAGSADGEDPVRMDGGNNAAAHADAAGAEAVPASAQLLPQAAGVAHSHRDGDSVRHEQEAAGGSAEDGLARTPTRPANVASKVSSRRAPSAVSRASRASAASRASYNSGASRGGVAAAANGRVSGPGRRAYGVHSHTGRYSSRQSFRSSASSGRTPVARDAGAGDDDEDDDVVGPVLGPIQPHVPRRPRRWRAPPSNGRQGYQRTRKSGLGKQSVAGRVTRPSFGFGTAPRAHAKLYAGHKLGDSEPRDETRDATTCNTTGAMGRQVDSRKANAPAASFGSSPRFSNKAFISRAHAAVDQVGVDSPGAVYARATQFRGAKRGRKNRRWRQGKHIVPLPNGRAAPAFSFGSGQRTLGYLRLQHRAAGDTGDEPGPGSFNPDATRARRGPAFSFGTEKRERSVKVSLGRGADNALLGSASPGPMAYFPDVTKSASHSRGPSHGFGDHVTPCYSDPLKPRPKPAPGPSLPHQDFAVEQANSKLPSAARTRFGGANKDPSFELPSRAVPGPGAYSPIHPQPSGFVPSPVKLSDLAQPSYGGFTFALAPRSTPPPM